MVTLNIIHTYSDALIIRLVIGINPIIFWAVSVLANSTKCKSLFVKLPWMPRYEEATVTHRGSVTPGKHNMKVFKLVHAVPDVPPGNPVFPNQQ